MTVPVFTGPVPSRLSSPETFSADTDSYHAELAGVIAGMNETAIAMNLNSTTDTSSTSLAISLGSKSLTVSTSKSFQAGMYLILADSAAPSTNSMVVQVTSYNAGTGAMVAECIQVKGSGTITSWVISQSASPSADISAAMLPVTSAATTEAGKVALGVPSQNIIDNSNFAINQRGVTGTVTLAAGAYGHDRWKAGSAGCTYTFAASAGITTITISAGSLMQVVEGLNLETATYTLSQSGTAQVRIVDGSYAASPIAVSATAGTNLSLEFGTGTVKQVKLEKGSLATPWVFPRPQIDLLNCQRFAVKLLNGGTQETLGTGFSTATTVAVCVLPLPTTMRATPTVAYLSGGSSNLAFGSPVAGTISSITSVALGTDSKSLRIDFNGTGFTIGCSLMRQNSGTPILFISADL